MKTLLLFLGLLYTTISIKAQESINGIWNSGQENTIIEIYNSTGIIQSSDNENATAGKLIIKDLIKEDNTYKGKLYLIRRNRWIDAEFVPSGDSLKIMVSAGFQKRTIVWKSVK